MNSNTPARSRFMSNRLSTLFERLDTTRYDGVVLNPGPTMQYLLGLPFHLMERPTLAFFAPGGRVTMVLPELEQSRLVDASVEIESFTYNEDPATWSGAIGRAASAAGLAEGRLAADPRWMRLLELEFLRVAAPRASVTGAGALFDALRLAKSDAELDLMRQAVKIAENGLRETIPAIRPGISERALAGILVGNLLRGGAEPTLPFSPIVAAGANAANPHAEPGDRLVAEGDVVLFDWGATYRGYHSDLTRVVCVGSPSDELSRVADLVLSANEHGRAAAAPGVAASSIDSATRSVIADAGYGPFFMHRTGHGLGMEVHEAPYIRSDSTDVLAPGMVFTIEPGVYLDGKFGVRIEDDVVVTETGAESLSTMERALIRLGAA